MPPKKKPITTATKKASAFTIRTKVNIIRQATAKLGANGLFFDRNQPTTIVRKISDLQPTSDNGSVIAPLQQLHSSNTDIVRRMEAWEKGVNISSTLVQLPCAIRNTEFWSRIYFTICTWTTEITTG